MGGFPLHIICYDVLAVTGYPWFPTLLSTKYHTEYTNPIIQVNISFHYLYTVGGGSIDTENLRYPTVLCTVSNDGLQLLFYLCKSMVSDRIIAMSIQPCGLLQQPSVEWTYDDRESKLVSQFIAYVIDADDVAWQSRRERPYSRIVTGPNWCRLNKSLASAVSATEAADGDIPLPYCKAMLGNTNSYGTA